jgi:formyl-CoA transferase
MWERLCRAIGAEELIDNPAFATNSLRSENRDALTVEIERRLAGAGSAAWIDCLNQAGVPCGRIYSIDEMFEDPQVQSLEMVETVESPYYHPLRLVGQGVRLSRTPSEVRLRPPECGEHTEEILASFGYTAQEIADLRGRRIV